MKKHSGAGAYHAGIFGRPTILMAKEGDGKPGGAGGDDGGGGDDDDDVKFTERFNKLFHKAMGEREKRLETKLMKGLETTLGTKFDDLVAKIGVEKPKGDDKPDDKNGHKPGEVPPEIKAQLTQMQKDLQATKELAEKHRKDAEDQKARSRKAEEINSLTQLLNGSVKPALLDMVVGQLHGNLTRDEEAGTILWKGSDGEILPLKDGIEAWKKSDAGKEVAPPRDARGSGGQGGTRGPTRPGDFGIEDLGVILAGTSR